MKITLLCIGDIVGRPGRQVLAEQLPNLVKQYDVDCVIANAENCSGGSGLTVAGYDKLLKYGVHLITMGDHVYRKREILETLQNSPHMVRPANLSPQASGKEWSVYTTDKGASVAVINLIGRMYMAMPSDNPFHAVQRILSRIPPDVKIIVVDMHAEATSEKIAMGWFLDGKVSLVFGTHTHVATADETILPNGTAYITDVGMTGPHRSVLGRNIEPVLKSLTTQMPYNYSIATSDLRLNAVVVTADSNTGKAGDIQRICIRQSESSESAYDSSDGKGSEFQYELP